MSQLPYMIRLCQKLFANSDAYKKPPEDDQILIGICSNWFSQAFDHCSRITTSKPGCTKLWTRIVNLKKFIFQENENSLLSDKMPMPIHPELLSLANCQELSEKVIKDYAHFAPRYMSVMQANRILWQVLWSILELLVLLVCLLVVRKWLSKKNTPVICNETSETKFFELENGIQRDVKRILYETKYLSVVPVINPQIFQICNCPIIGLRINRSQLINIERIWNGSVAQRTCENPADADITLMQRKLHRFFQKSGPNLMIISIEFDRVQDEGIESKKSPRTSFIPVHQKAENKIGIKRRI